MNYSLYTSLDTLRQVSVPYSTCLSLPSSLSPNQSTASNVLKVSKTKEEIINAIDESAKYPSNSIHDHDYHAWCVDKKGNVCNYSDATLLMSVEHPSWDLIRRPFSAQFIQKWLVICEDQYKTYIQNMANANCGGDITAMKTQLTIIFMINPSQFPDLCCYPRAKLLHKFNLQKYSLVIGSLGFRHANGTIFWEYGWHQIYGLLLYL